MAIYHCSLRVFSRAENHSAVAAAAYRSGQKLTDERTGTIHRYEKRLGVVNTFILMPSSSPDRFQNRFTLWNAAEASETRKNSRVAREVIIALPYELTTLERESLTRDMAAYLASKYRVAVDVAIHAPVDKDGHDPRNHHAHLLFTTRELTPEGFGSKTRILDDKVTGPQQIEIIREVWETLANDALSRAGHSDVNIDRRTLEAQGIERIPQIHEGKASTYDDDLHGGRHDESEEEDDTDTEDGDDGKTDGKKSGSGDTSSRSPDMSLKEDIAEKPLSEDKLETRDKSRSEFNAEIKALNAQRAEFPDKPLSDQIKELEQEIDHLDRRVERLATLLNKTTLPQKLQKLIGDMATKAIEFLALRTEGQIKRALSESEKTERHERQLARYGRTYRESIHSQIRDMKDKIETLQSRETEYKKYRSFVTMIETEVMKLRASQAHTLNTPQKPDIGSVSPVTPTKPPEQVKPAAKPSERPAGTQAKVPDEHKPSSKAERLQETFGKVQSDKQQTASPTMEKSVQSRSPIATETKTDAQKPVETKTITGTQSPNPKDYKIAANAQTKQILDKIHTELKAQKAQEAATKPEKPKTTGKDEGLKGQFRKPEQPPVKEEDHRRKTKAEAEKKRQGIPPEYRAPPYTKEELNPNRKSEPKAATAPQGESVLDKFKKMWRQETAKPQSNPEQPKQSKPRRPMSSSFNQVAKKPKDMGPSPNPEQKRDLH